MDELIDIRDCIFIEKIKYTRIENGCVLVCTGRLKCNDYHGKHYMTCGDIYFSGLWCIIPAFSIKDIY